MEVQSNGRRINCLYRDLAGKRTKVMMDREVKYEIVGYSKILLRRIIVGMFRS